ncbi:MAG: endonuclease MutS2 [Armatimonadota bacterium]
MEEHTLRVLEFEKVVSRLQDQAACSIGREVAGLTYPTTDLETAKRKQRETSEARDILQYVGTIPLGGISDIRTNVERARIEALLQPHDLLSIQATLQSSGRLRTFLERLTEKYPILSDLATEIERFEAIETAISDCISQSGEVLNTASPTLARVRAELQIAHSRLSEKMNSYLQSSQYRTAIQEPIITIRGDRYCIPVKAEYRGVIPGIVHDSSASGATLFIEPTAVVELGNKRKQLVIKEREEVEKVLAELTARVGQRADQILATLKVVGIIDCICARAKLSIAHSATEPILNNTGYIEIKSGRHPLLEGDVVPIDVSLGKSYNAILITGPNTGGKTVSLKTIGLFALMAASGLHIPAEVGTELAIFQQIYADIGDEQSIEQSLSTFSSHMNNIVRITRGATANALVLMDEIGAGTDPAEGAALAKAILDYLLNKGARIVATTHYGELKEFAYQHQGIENARVEFDPETLRPTYRLQVGIPGASNAFAIAGRLGLDQSIIASAKGSLGSRMEAADELIRRLEETQRAAAQEKAAAQRITSDADALRRRYEEQVVRLESVKHKVEARVRDRAQAMLDSYQRKLDATLEQLAAQKKDTRRAQDLKKKAEKLIEQFDEASAATPPKEPEDERLSGTFDLRPGAAVRIANVNQDGEIVEGPVDGKVVVLIGSMRVTVPISTLRKAKETGKETRPASTESTIAMQKAREVQPEIHLRGLRAEQALIDVDKYLDDAMAGGLQQVRIIHGKGTGTLRQVVWDLLKNHPGVKSYRLGESSEGGSGATVVTMK